MRFCSFSNSNSKLIQNARAGNLDRVRDLLRRGVDVNAQNEYGDAALVWASSNGHVEVVRALLKVEVVDVNIKDIDGGTALMYASWKGHLEVARDLLSHVGVDVNIKDINGETALIMASEKCYLKVIHALLNHVGVDVNIKDNGGNTALIVASEMGHLELIHALLNHTGVDVNIKDEYGKTALIVASKKGHLEVVRALLKHVGVDVNIKDKYGYTALDFARIKTNNGVARLLEEHMEHVKQNPAGSGAKHLEPCYPPCPNENSPSSDDAKIKQDRSRLLHVMNAASAEPVGFSLEYITQCLNSDKRKKLNAEEEQSPYEEDELNRKKDADLKQAVEGKRCRQEWINRTAGIGAVQRLIADPRLRNDNALQAMTPTLNKTETGISK